ncbi:AAA family ATPase [uncultured Jatrophihabitans sp.]|uniref:AAA family ATPase n=1 Tax=uncultured Jatrophihabitans sp. TaxID=1610747 RepID=UPI0035CA0374
MPVTAVRFDRQAAVGITPEHWPGTIAAVRQLMSDGLTLDRVTVLVGENGSGKSTLVEAIAQAYGLAPEGGSTGARHSTRESESPLHRALVLRRGIGASRWGFFLRAETMHGFFTYRERNPSGALLSDDAIVAEQFHEMSHGESFLEILADRFDDAGLYVLDEPESALSFAGCLALVGLLHRIGQSPARQAIVATHSPIVAAVPGATILEVGEWGLRRVAWEDLELVQNWRDFLGDPSIFLRQVLDD